MESRQLRLGEFLCREGLIRSDQLEEALSLQKDSREKLGEILVSRGWVDDRTVTRILARMYQLPFVSLSEIEVDQDLLSRLPADILEERQIVPLELKDSVLTVAINNPLDIGALQDIQNKSGCQIRPVMASRDEIARHLRDHTDSLHTIGALRAMEENKTDGSTVKQLVQSLIGKAVRERASDIHFETQKDKMRVRFRVDGVLYERASIPKDLARNVISRIKIISGMDVAETRRPQDGRSTLRVQDEDYDLRISTLPDILGENLVLRILHKDAGVRDFAQLGLEPGQIGIMERMIRRPYGLILVTGPTGAGKSTTLYSMLERLNETSKNIISVEDPVEYKIEGITQTGINNLSGYTFARAMRHILRHDPDIIMIGEIRDLETAEIAVRAALTGHLVLSTMHTNNAAGAMTRLLEMNIEPFLIYSSVVAVVAQRLVRTLCPHCRQPVTPSGDVSDMMQEFSGRTHPGTISRPVGCPRCLESGYQGRTGIFEILEVDADVRPLILKSADENRIVQKALARGMQSLKMSGLKKVAGNMTSLEEVLRMTSFE